VKVGNAIAKTSLTERDICTKYILPALKQAGWKESCEYNISKARNSKTAQPAMHQHFKRDLYK
jgi:type I site-specific restriction endonuclease